MVPIISIIVPVFNEEKYLANCVASLRQQSLQNIEIILVDDGSTDRSPQIIAQMASEEARIRVVHQEHAGASAARNLGMQFASSEYVGFVDGDDWLDPDMYATLLQMAQQHKCDISRCGYYRHGDKKSPRPDDKPSPPKIYGHGQILRQILPAMIGRSPRQPGVDDVIFGSACLCIFRSDFLSSNYLEFDQTPLYEDVLFCMRSFALCRTMVSTPEPLYHYRLNEASLQHSYGPGKWEMGLYLYRQKKELVQDFCLGDESLERLALLLIFIARMAIANECLQTNPKTRRDKLATIRAICAHPDLQRSLRDLSPCKLERPVRLLMFLMRHRHSHLLYLLFRRHYGKERVLDIHLK